MQIRHFCEKEHAMSLSKLIAVAVLLCAWGGANAIGGEISDNDLKTALVGTWVNPPDSDAAYLPARQVFHRDGTTSVYIYATAECLEPAAIFEGRWSVVDGMLITQITRSSHPDLVAVGQVERVTILALESDRVVINAADAVYVREKSDTCYPPDAHRT
jgi:hypothetical protein